MSFASVLNAYCNALGCTNKEIAERCGLSPSALSRYRNNERTPDAGSDAIDHLVTGIVALSLERGVEHAWREDIVRSAFEASLSKTKPTEASFGVRINAIMSVLGMRNAEVAHALGVSPSYISRIRSGQRMASGQRALAERFSQTAAQRCIELGKTVELVNIIDPSGGNLDQSYLDLDSQLDLAKTIERWLFGNSILETDLSAMESFYEKLDGLYFEEELDGIRALVPITADYSDTEQWARFYYGTEQMKYAETLFFELCAKRGAREVYLTTDMPLLEVALEPDFVENYRLRIGSLIKNETRITVIHSLERSLAETIVALEIWLPLYLTGLVKPYFLSGMGSKLFAHVNYVSDVCALAAEAVIGHQTDGRYYLTTKPDDIAYYRKKMDFIFEQVSSMLEIYRVDDSEQQALFEESENARRKKFRGRVIGEGRYNNLDIVSYPGDSVVVTVHCTPVVHLVIRHPKLRYVTSRMK